MTYMPVSTAGTFPGERELFVFPLKELGSRFISRAVGPPPKKVPGQGVVLSESPGTITFLLEILKVFQARWEYPLIVLCICPGCPGGTLFRCPSYANQFTFKMQDT